MNFQGRCSLLFDKRQMGFLSTHPAQSTIRQRQKQQSPRHLAGLRGKNPGPQHSPKKWNTIKTALSYPASGSTCSGSWAVGREVKLKPVRSSGWAVPKVKHITCLPTLPEPSQSIAHRALMKITLTLPLQGTF